VIDSFPQRGCVEQQFDNQLPQPDVFGFESRLEPYHPARRFNAVFPLRFGIKSLRVNRRSPQQGYRPHDLAPAFTPYEHRYWTIDAPKVKKKRVASLPSNTKSTIY